MLIRPLSSTATIAAASTLGTTRRWIGEMPSTSIASISSRMVRAPRSAQIAVPPAPAISSAQMIGAACCTLASTLTAPANEGAPSCRSSEPSCREMTAPNAMETSAAGRIDTLAMNQSCSMNSRSWNGRLKVLRATSSPRANTRPTWRNADVGLAISGLLTSRAPLLLTCGSAVYPRLTNQLTYTSSAQGDISLPDDASAMQREAQVVGYSPVWLLFRPDRGAYYGGGKSNEP